MTKLYQISQEYRELAKLAEDADEDMAVAVRDTIGAIAGEFEEKAKAVATIALNVNTDVEAIDAEIERLKERKRIIQNRVQGLKDYLRENMEATGITKISCPVFTITLSKGRESVVVDDESAIPDDLMRVTTKIDPDKTAIAAKIKAGEEVPGAHLERGKGSILIK